MTLEAINYRRGELEILNQLLLPHHTIYEEIITVKDGWEAINQMKVTFSFRNFLVLSCVVSSYVLSKNYLGITYFSTWTDAYIVMCYKH